MAIKVFISGLSGNKEVKKRQQRVLMILDSKAIDYTVIDITEPGKESDKEFMQQNAKSGTSDSTVKSNPLPPQIFNEEDYCGNYDEFDLANEMDDLEKFLKLPAGSLGTGTLSNSPTSPKISADKENEFVPENTASDAELNETFDNNDPFESNDVSKNETEDIFEMDEDKDVFDGNDEQTTIDELDIVNGKEVEEEGSTEQPEAEE